MSCAFPERDRPTVDVALDTAAGERGEVYGLGDRGAALFGAAHDGCRERVLATALEARRRAPP